MRSDAAAPEYGQPVRWEPARPRLRPLRVVVSWIVAAASVYAAALIPGFDLESPGAAFLIAAIIAIFNAVLPPIIAALRLPLTLGVGFLLVLFVDALALVLADDVVPELRQRGLVRDRAAGRAGDRGRVDGAPGDRSGPTTTTITRCAWSGASLAARERAPGTDTPGIIFLEIDGLALPVLRRAMRDGNAPAMARWMAEDGYRLAEWETDLSSQTGASQAGILLGSNEDIPAFRWVEKETGTMMVCSSPEPTAPRSSAATRPASDCWPTAAPAAATCSRARPRRSILTVSRMEAEKRANPGYRAFLANGFNVTRALVLFVWEVLLEWTAALRAARRDVRPRGTAAASIRSCAARCA